MKVMKEEYQLVEEIRSVWGIDLKLFDEDTETKFNSDSIASEEDSKDEDDETIRITLSGDLGDENEAGTENMTFDYTITNDDLTKPTLYFSAATTDDKAEADATKAVTVTLSAISGLPSSVSYAIAGTATASGDGTDFADGTTGAGTLAFAADTDQTKDITITFTDDKIDEATETIVITLSGFSGGAQEGGQSTHTINLADSDDPPALGFDISGEATENNVSKAENSTYTPSIVMATGYSSDFPISIIWSIDEGVTTAVIDGQTNEDFEIRSTDGVALATYSGLNDAARTVTFPAGASSVNLLTISMPKDDLYEDSEILKLQIATPTSMSALDGSGNAASANGSFITSGNGNVQSTKTITITNSADETVPKVSRNMAVSMRCSAPIVRTC